MLNIPASRIYQIGEVIFSEGDPGDCSYFIENGEVEIYISRDGQEHILAVLQTNDIFGEMAIIDAFPRSASARARTTCQLGFIHKEQLRDRLDEADSVVKMLVDVLLQRLRREVFAKQQSRTTSPMSFSPVPAPGSSLQAVSTPHSEGAAIHKFKMEGLLRNALAADEMRLHYQPIVHLPSNQTKGFEALIRWKPAHGNLLFPDNFISVCEETNLILPVGRWVIKQALSDLRRVIDETNEEYFMSVNVSGRQIFDEQFFTTLEENRILNDLPPSLIKLEMTEQVFVKGDRALEWVEKAHQLGYTLALDDFGTGYSSFQYLGHLPLDFLKVDKSFVQKMHEDPKCYTITKAIIQLGENFQIPTIAEGIQEDHQLKALKALSCEFGQGYLFQKPMDCSNLISFLGLKRAA